jgi:hypothetical protein
VVDTSIFAKSIMGRREYKKMLGGYTNACSWSSQGSC